MQMDQERKKATMEELKHYINGKIEALKKELISASQGSAKSKPVDSKKVAKIEKEKAIPKKVTREKAIRGE
jgi:hypothetical protein